MYLAPLHHKQILGVLKALGSFCLHFSKFLHHPLRILMRSGSVASSMFAVMSVNSPLAQGTRSQRPTSQPRGLHLLKHPNRGSEAAVQRGRLRCL